MQIAIQPDDYTDPAHPERLDSSSTQWAKELRQRGHDVRFVDVQRPDILDHLSDCDGFMWRWGHCQGMYRIAKRLLPVLENYLKMQVYPEQATCWHYDDKIAQTFILQSLKIAIPRTWIFFDADDAKTWAKSAQYPLVAKLATGAGSNNVACMQDFGEVVVYIDVMFSQWNHELPRSRASAAGNIIPSLRMLTKGKTLRDYRDDEPQRGYVYLQEFLKGNEFDTRVTVIGNRAFAFRRLVRDGDFRASGSGQISYAKDEIDERFVRLAFDTAAKIGTQSLAIDGLFDNQGNPVVGELSYTYASWAVNDCPGHWQLDGSATNGELSWIDGSMSPEEAQVSDFLGAIEERRK